MKKVYLSTAVLIGFVTASLQAGTEVYKQVAPPPPPMYGLGFYGAIDMKNFFIKERQATNSTTPLSPSPRVSATAAGGKKETK